jgi:hypothetical protein
MWSATNGHPRDLGARTGLFGTLPRCVAAPYPPRMGRPSAVPMPGRAAAPPGTRDRRENVLLRELVAVYSHLSGLASQDGEVDGVVRLVARRTGASVAVLGPGLDVLAAVPDDTLDRLRAAVGATQLGPVLAAAARNRRPVSLTGPGAEPAPVVIAPVLVGDDVAAHLVTVGAARDADGEPELDDDLGLLLAEHAATMCGIILGRERVVAAAAGRARLDLIEGLLLARDRDDGEAERWAGHLGFVRGVAHHVLALGLGAAPAGSPPALPARPGAPDPARVLALAEQAARHRRPDAIVGLRDTEVVAVVPGRVDTAGAALDGARALGEQCLAALAARHPGVAVLAGVGGACREPTEIARSYTEARGALAAAGRMGRAPGVVAFDDLGVHRLLLQVPDLGELRAFAVDVLGELVRSPEHAAEPRADLLDTLIAWFRSNGSPQRTARELHVHPNTVTYRVRRVEEITGLRLDSYRDRLMAQVACEIVQVLGDQVGGDAGRRAR